MRLILVPKLVLETDVKVEKNKIKKMVGLLAIILLHNNIGWFTYWNQSGTQGNSGSF